MTTFKDKCFCSFYKNCKLGQGCHRALTKEVVYKAHVCGMLIDQFLKRPECFVDKQDKTIIESWDTTNG